MQHMQLQAVVLACCATCSLQRLPLSLGANALHACTSLFPSNRTPESPFPHHHWLPPGSMNMSYDSSNLTTPDIKWLGVRPSDLDRFNIPQQCRLPMTDEDIRTGKKLVSSRVLDACV